jgi:hypothetical protein
MFFWRACRARKDAEFSKALVARKEAEFCNACMALNTLDSVKSLIIVLISICYNVPAVDLPAFMASLMVLLGTTPSNLVDKNGSWSVDPFISLYQIYGTRR